MKWNSQVGDLTKLILLLGRSLHLHQLLSFSRVDKAVANLYHACYREERLVVLFLKEVTPWLVFINALWK